MASDTVKLNVGGKRFEVARSLIESYPETMLSALISKRWKREREKPNDNDALFIDRDGGYFHHVLSYMRDKQVHLPLSVSKQAVLQELGYFGFEGVPSDAINYDGCGNAAAAAQFLLAKKDFKADLSELHERQEVASEELKERIEEFKIHRAYLILAYACFLDYHDTGILTNICLQEIMKHVDKLDGNHMFSYFCHSNFDLDRVLFNTSLQKYGLQFDSRSGRAFNLRLLETSIGYSVHSGSKLVGEDIIPPP